MVTIYLIIALFGFSTIMGFYLSSLVLQDKVSSIPLIIIHGVFTIAGFVLLCLYYPESLKSLFFFSLATLFGLKLLYQGIKHIKFTKWLCDAHGLMSIIGFVYLLRLV